jgi:hypothetical protein
MYKLHGNIKQGNFFLPKTLAWNGLKFIAYFCCSCLMTDCLCWVSGSTWPTSSHSARCPYCMRVFVNNTNLKIHIRDVHSVDKGPFICNKCGKLVKNRGSLRVHTYRFHTPKMWKLLSQTITLGLTVTVIAFDVCLRQNARWLYCSNSKYQLLCYTEITLKVKCINFKQHTLYTIRRKIIQKNSHKKKVKANWFSIM